MPDGGSAPVRVNVSSTERQADAGSGLRRSYDLADNGRFTSFVSDATNLVPGDTNGVSDIFVRDIAGGTTERVSVGVAGAQANGPSDVNSISRDGRFVAFDSSASNLVAGDTNGASDIFVRDRTAGVTTRVSVSSAGAQAGGFSGWPSISGNGRYVAFQSAAANLVPGDSNGLDDVFVHDRRTGRTTRVSVTPLGGQANDESVSPTISDNGQVVVFTSLADNLSTGDGNQDYDVFVRDRAAGTTELVSRSVTGDSGSARSFGGSLSADGRFVGFASEAEDLVTDDTNAQYDQFVRDRANGTTARVNLTPAGTETIFGSSLLAPQLSGDGRFVALTDGNAELTSAGRGVVVRDLVAGTNRLVSLTPSGAPSNGVSAGGVLSSTGRRVVFASVATNLVPGDTNGVDDLFTRILW